MYQLWFKHRSRFVAIIALGLLIPTMGSEMDCDDYSDFLVDTGDHHDADNNNLNGNTNTTPSTTPQVSIGASSTEVAGAQSLTFTANTSDGTPPYWIYWMLEGDSGWTLGGTSFTRDFDLAPGQTKTVYCQLADANGVYSNLASLTVTGAAGSTDTPCPFGITGTYRTIQGFVDLIDVGGSVAGTYGHIDGSFEEVIDGTFSGGAIGPGAPGCPDCVTLLDALWTGFDGNSGVVEFTFAPNLLSFDGKWSFTGNSHWESSPWDGWRSTCDE